MQHKLTAVQWNIGGGLIRQPDAEPANRGDYNQEDVSYIIDRLGQYDVDIITMQETHSDDRRVQVEQIATELGYHWIEQAYAPSHIMNGQWLGQAVLSRLPFASEPEPIALLTPRDWQAIQDNGEIWGWRNRGVTTADLAVADDVRLSVATLHLPVFKRLGHDPTGPEAHEVLREVQSRVLQGVGAVALLQGDFNIDDANMRGYLGDLFVCNFRQHIQDHVTTPNGLRYDHVLSRGAPIVTSRVDPGVLTDHYPLISEIAIPV